VPLREDLKPVIRKLMFRHYPAVSDFDKLWQLQWIDELVVSNADQLGFSMTQFFTTIQSKQELPELENYETMLRLYARPKVPHLSSMNDYKGWVLTDEQRQAIEESVAESNQYEIGLCEEINQLKAEYINEVQPVIFKHVGAMINDMTTEMWNRYGIEVGFAYDRFADNCLDLLYEVITKELTEDPGMGFFNYRCRDRI